MSWDHIVGHAEIVRRLRSAVAGSRLHPALLFEGPGGVGKRLTALTLAQAHHCPSAASRKGDPCGVCPSCRAIADSAAAEIVEESQSRHPGVRIVSLSRPDEREVRFGGGSGRGEVRTQITVPQIRVVLSERLTGGPGAPPRFVIIDPADRMGESAANALLKTLEEPPPSLRFVLVTSKPSALLPTIRSRCVALRFTLLSSTEVRRALERKLGAAPGETKRTQAGAGPVRPTSPGKPRSAFELDVDLVSSLAAGQVGRALELAEGPALARFYEMRTPLLESLEALARGLPAGTFAIVAGAAFRGRERAAWHEGIGVLEVLLRDLAVLSVDPGADVVNTDIRPRLAAVASALGVRAARALHALDAVRSDMRVNVNARLAAERILIEVAG